MCEKRDRVNVTRRINRLEHLYDLEMRETYNENKGENQLKIQPSGRVHRTKYRGPQVFVGRSRRRPSRRRGYTKRRGCSLDRFKGVAFPSTSCVATLMPGAQCIVGLRMVGCRLYSFRTVDGLIYADIKKYFYTYFRELDERRFVRSNDNSYPFLSYHRSFYLI